MLKNQLQEPILPVLYGQQGIHLHSPRHNWTGRGDRTSLAPKLSFLLLEANPETQCRCQNTTQHIRGGRAFSEFSQVTSSRSGAQRASYASRRASSTAISARRPSKKDVRESKATRFALMIASLHKPPEANRVINDRFRARKIRARKLTEANPEANALSMIASGERSARARTRPVYPKRTALSMIASGGTTRAGGDPTGLPEANRVINDRFRIGAIIATINNYLPKRTALSMIASGDLRSGEPKR
jgi:hypothetical protein